MDQVLRDRDRVEVYRPLLVDPKVARRERFRRQGARAPGCSRSGARGQAGLLSGLAVAGDDGLQALDFGRARARRP
jgi:hypothetical protein